jgi:biofilm PGA synthesis N-glycosyltransferase PgaC
VSDAVMHTPATTTPAPARAGRRYAVITPCRNEAEFLPVTIETMVAQTVRPTVWVIVDDGSTDATPEIVEAAAREHPWIRLHRRRDRGARAVGGGVIEAFDDGLATINLDDYDYVCKLDADLGLPPRYFERLMERMEADPLLGNFSGKTYVKTPAGRWVSERMGDENAIGPTKFYRVACFKDIGGFVRQVCWDGIDGHVCRMRGWKAMSLDEEDIRVRHYRPHGSSQHSVWVGRQRWGRGKYFMGSSLLYMLGVAAYRSIERPYVIGSVGLLVGYLRACWSGHERYDDPAYIRHLRRYELQSLFFGKRRTMNRYHARIERAAAARPGNA